MTLMTLALGIAAFSLLVVLLDLVQFMGADSPISWEDLTVDFSIMDDVMEMEYWGTTLDDHAERVAETKSQTKALEVLRNQEHRVLDLVRAARVLAQMETKDLDPMNAPPVWATKVWKDRVLEMNA